MISQQFSSELDKKLWAAADRLRSNLDAAVYKHAVYKNAVLSLIFLKYVPDSFVQRQAEIEFLLKDPPSDFFLDHGDFDPIASIPFQYLNLHAKGILGNVYEFFLGKFDLFEAKKGGQPSGARQTRPNASPKGWRKGTNQYFTPKSVVSLIVEMIKPYQRRVYVSAMGSDDFFLRSEHFIEEHGDVLGNLWLYGQDKWGRAAHLRRAPRARRVRPRRKQPNQSNPTTWRLAAMNMAICGIDFNLGKEAANSSTNGQPPDLRADYVMANPPFNNKEWWNAKLEDDARWSRSEAETAPHFEFCTIWGTYGTPPQGNSNFSWIQHMLHNLAPNGSMALLLANGSVNSNSGGEGATHTTAFNSFEFGPRRQIKCFTCLQLTSLPAAFSGTERLIDYYKNQ